MANSIIPLGVIFRAITVTFISLMPLKYLFLIQLFQSRFKIFHFLLGEMEFEIPPCDGQGPFQ